MTKSEYDAQVQQLVGLRIVDVRYHEILYTDENGSPFGEPEWNRNPAFDSLDYGIDLDLDDGSMCHVTWGDEFEQYGLSIKRSPQCYVGTIQVWPVAQESRWRPLLNQRIVTADVYWEWGQYQDDRERIDYPQSLQVTFENGAQVYLSAFEIRGDDFQMGCIDHITVFFENKTAVKFCAWPAEESYAAT